MLYDWFISNIFGSGSSVPFQIGGLTFYLFPGGLFVLVMFSLFLWASFHLITDIIMAFRAVFGFGYKKRKGGSH